MSIRLRNFMAYGEAEFQFNPHLNLILGPNGSGKSGFVAALCLGLAGSQRPAL